MKLLLELFTANICSRCAAAKSVMSGVAEELGSDQCELSFIDVVKNLDYSVERGVLRTPALVVNGKLMFSPLPGRELILQAIERELEP